MVSRDLPIDIMRIVSLNRVRKFRRLFRYLGRCHRTPRPRTAGISSNPSLPLPSDDPLCSIRSRAAATQDSTLSDAALRAERIARIQASIAEGRYRVSASDLAQKMIDNMLANRPPAP